MGNTAIKLDNSARFTARLRAVKEFADCMDMSGLSLEHQALEICRALRDLDTDDPRTLASITAIACNVADEAGL